MKAQSHTLNDNISAPFTLSEQLLHQVNQSSLQSETTKLLVNSTNGEELLLNIQKNLQYLKTVSTKKI